LSYRRTILLIDINKILNKRLKVIN